MRFVVLLWLATMLGGCAPKQESEYAHKTLIFVSIPPQAGLLSALAGEHVEVRTLIGEGQSPHAYEPTARQLTALDDADLFFTIGAPFEQALLNKIQPLYPALPVVGTGDQIIRRAMPHEHHAGHCTGDHGEEDPHIWLSAGNAALIAAGMLHTLEQIDPDNQPYYQENYKRLSMVLEQIHINTVEQLAPYRGSRWFCINHS